MYQSVARRCSTRKTGRYAPSFSRPLRGGHARFASWGPSAPMGGLRPSGITGPGPMTTSGRRSPAPADDGRRSPAPADDGRRSPAPADDVRLRPAGGGGGEGEGSDIREIGF